ncbi:MAG: mechanosensitive ion channel family protein, partial [Aquificaceae bacterium]|nr:mechanosensitive ion channel family protein [Aquificaceae bacterium]
MSPYKSIALIALLPALGFLTERFLLYGLREFMRKRGWHWGELLVSSLRFVPTLWALLLALHLTSQSVELPKSLLSLKDKLLWLFLILSFSLFLSRLVGNFVTLYMKSYREDMPATSLVSQIARVVVLLVGTIVALDKVGIAITPLITAFGIGGLAVALAVRDTLENLFAGFHMLATRHIKPGDY